jgi:hypothetical protein
MTKTTLLDPADLGISPPAGALAAYFQPIIATGYVAICAEGGLWAVARSPEACLNAARQEVERSKICVDGADKLVNFRLADFTKAITAVKPNSDEVVVFLCTQRVIDHMLEDGDGCIPWRACGNIVDLCDEPDCDQLPLPGIKVNPWRPRDGHVEEDEDGQD